MKKLLIILLFYCSASFGQTNNYNTLDNSAVNNLIFNNYTFIYPSSGSLAVTTGVLTLTTALNQIYPNSYMYFPAGTWTGSTAGWYYTTCSSTTSCLVYSNSYTSGIPTTPTSPTLVTTGVGAYVQSTGPNVTGQLFTIPANVMGANGRMYVETFGYTNNSVSSKFLEYTFGGNNLGTNSKISSSNYVNNYLWIFNLGSVSSQYAFSFDPFNAGNALPVSVNTAASTTLGVAYSLGTATDYIVVQSVFVQVTR